MTRLNVASDQVATAKKRRKPRIYHAAGPGSLIEAYKHWRDGVELPTEMAVTYSSQFFTACRNLGVEAIVVASSPAYPKAEEFRDGDFTVRERPCPWEAWRGPIFQVGEIYGNLLHIFAILRARADVAVFQGGYLHWYLYTLLRIFGVRIVPVMMVVLWPKYKRTGLFRRMMWKLNGLFFRFAVSEIVSMSEDCSRQVTESCGGHPPPIRPFLPRYREGLFKEISPKPPSPPFRVLYVGRIVRYKGVFDLVDIARRFAAEGRADFIFDACGAGGDFDEMRKEIEISGLADRFRMHGHCDQATMRNMYAAAHVVIVPTRTDFIEGFNQVVAEAVISGTPVVTSAVCPALEMVSNAAVEVPPDDVRAYGDALLRLRDDPAFYEEKRSACAAVREKFLNSDLTYDHVMEDILRRILEGRGLIA